MGPRPYELWIALRYLKARRSEVFISLITWLSVGGVALGVAALVVVVSVMTGFEETLRAKMLGLNPHVVVYPMGSVLADPDRVVAAAREVEGVVDARPFVMSQVMLTSRSGTVGGVLRGIALGGSADLAALETFVADGDLAALGAAPPTLMLGKEVARRLAVEVGDPVQLMVPAGSVPRIRSYRVGALFASGMHDYDANFVFASLAAVRDLLQMGETAGGVEIRVTDVYQARVVAHKVADSLGAGYWIRDWMEMNRVLFSALKLQKTVLSIILALIVLVAAFNVAASLIMVVMEKTRDIGILKSMGSANRSIRRIFVLKGVAIGTVGTLAGLLLGGLICAFLARYPIIKIPSDVYYIDRLPVVVTPLAFAAVGLGAVGLCYLATLYPSWQAARMDPVEILRDG